jgi:hypothetical protein
LLYYGDKELWEKKNFIGFYDFNLNLLKFERLFRRALNIYRDGFKIPLKKGSNLSHNTKLCTRLFNDFPDLYLNYEKKMRNGGHEVIFFFLLNRDVSFFYFYLL